MLTKEAVGRALVLLAVLTSDTRAEAAGIQSLGECEEYIEMGAAASGSRRAQSLSCTVTGLTGVERSYDATGRATVVETASTFFSSEYDVTVSISAFGDFPSFFAFAHIEVWGDGPVPCEAYTSGSFSSAVCPGMFSHDGTFTVVVVAESS